MLLFKDREMKIQQLKLKFGEPNAFALEGPNSDTTKGEINPGKGIFYIYGIYYSPASGRNILNLFYYPQMLNAR